MKLPYAARFCLVFGALTLVATGALAQPAADPSAEPEAPVSPAPAQPAQPGDENADETPDAAETESPATGDASPPQEAAPQAEAAQDAEADADAAPEASGEPEAFEEDDDAPAAPAGPLVPRTSCHGKRIRDIVVHGNGRVTTKDILVTMKLAPGLTCTDDELSKDAKALWDLGFFDDLVFEVETDGPELVLHVAVGEKPAIGKITFEGHDNVDEEDIDEKVALSVGQILSEAKVREQVSKIRDLYAEEGYFLAKVTYRLEALPNNEVSVVYDIDEGPEVSVRRVRFVGNDTLDDAELLDFMRTHPTGFLSFLSSNNTFKRDFFDEDMLRLQALYFDRGFLEVQVDEPRVELTPDRREIDVTIPIHEGPRFKIGRVRVEELGPDGGSVEPLDGRRKLRSMLDFDTGEWFSRSKVSEGVEAITRHYRDASFAKVQVDPQTDLEAEDRVVHVTLLIQRGPPVHIERIQIQGNDKTRDKVIRREILVNEGDDYSMTRLEASKARINALGYFERVDVAEEQGREENGMVVTFEVAEKATGTFQVGAGFSSIEQFVLTAQIQQQNLFGHGQSLSLNAQLSGLRQLVELQFYEPYLLDSMWSASLDLSHTRSNLQDFTQKQTATGFGLGHPIFHRNLRATVRYRASIVQIDDSTGGLFTGSTAQGRNLLQNLPIENLQLDGFTSSLRFSLTWDSRNNRMFPTKGIYSSISTEVADPVLGSQRTFVKNEVFGRFYYPVFRQLVLKLNTQLGLVTSRSGRGVPLYERYFLGGIMSMRGFDLQAIGPQIGLPTSINPLLTPFDGGFSIGGNFMARYNLELEFPIVDAVGIKGVFFHDGGNTWNLEDQLCQGPETPRGDPTTDPCSFSKLRFSMGFGLRWFSPLGPLRFEWGIPAFRTRRSWERPIDFQFTIGNFF